MHKNLALQFVVGIYSSPLFGPFLINFWARPRGPVVQRDILSVGHLSSTWIVWLMSPRSEANGDPCCREGARKERDGWLAVLKPLSGEHVTEYWCVGWDRPVAHGAAIRWSRRQ